MRRSLFFGTLAIVAMTIFSCKKDNTVISRPEKKVGQPINGNTLSGSVKGTIISVIR